MQYGGKNGRLLQECLFRQLIFYKVKEAFRSRGNILSIGQPNIHGLGRFLGKMHDPVLPERTVDLIVDANAKPCFYHRIGCINVHSGKLGVRSNVAAGENAGIIHVLSRISLDVGLYSKGFHGNGFFFG